MITSQPYRQLKNAILENDGIWRARFAPDYGDWSVYRIIVQSTPTGTTVPNAYMYITPEPSTQAPSASYLESGTLSGQFDENDTQNPYYVPLGQSLVIAWSGATLSGAMAAIEYENSLS